MGNSQSADLNPTLNTVGNRISKGLVMIPHVGSYLSLLFQSIAMKLEIFRSKPVQAHNETMMTMERIAREARASVGDPGISEKNFLDDAKKMTDKALLEAKQAKEEVEKLKQRLQETESREQEQLRAELEELRKQVAAARSREEGALVKVRRCYGQLDPAQLPSKEEIEDARRRIEYSDEKYHFAVCGFTGTGKSSLINAFRGLNPKAPGAAPVGANETTRTIKRYPDPSLELPYSRLVWYDLPGGGTSAVPSKNYYIKQGLFSFDALLLVYADRFTELDEQIIKDCVRNNTPVFIVRSKADQHINNMISDDYNGDDESPEAKAQHANEFYPKAKAKHAKDTESFFDECLRRMADESNVNERDKLLLQDKRMYRVYVVSAKYLLSLVKGYRNPAGGAVMDESKMNHEAELIEQMLMVAGERRVLRMRGHRLRQK